ncbi:hypothetical protein BC629DRAFT_1505894 [Irpex lacteus]|nr:hypothetical protein BC629DRAFT_1505894 [Irpex lacteus]
MLLSIVKRLLFWVGNVGCGISGSCRARTCACRSVSMHRSGLSTLLLLATLTL